jgi:hypothetical protein
MTDPPKRIKRLLREQAGHAHEEELRRALVPVAEAFKRWERGELGSMELSDIIHRFHQGPARELFTRYDTPPPYLELAVAHAITAGIIDRQTIPGELLDHLARALALYESQQAGDGAMSFGRGDGPR